MSKKINEFFTIMINILNEYKKTEKKEENIQRLK